MSSLKLLIRRCRFLLLLGALVFTSCKSDQSSNHSSVSVSFTTSDNELQSLYDNALEKCKGNIAQFGKYKVLVEGAQYLNVWLETQPMGGYMYGKRDLEIARNNIEIFMDHQREDGRLPGMIRKSENQLIAEYGWLQGFCFAKPAFETYFLLNKDQEFIRKLYKTLEDFDAFLWKTRDSDHNGCLETWCVWDTGEDNSIRLGMAPNAWPYDYPPSPDSIEIMTESEKREVTRGVHQNDEIGFVLPIESMDFMSYSYTSRNILAKISRETGNEKEDYWRQKAENVQKALKSHLWDSLKNACFDLDADNKKMDVLIHNNLRCMYYGSFDQTMADSFIQHHLMNKKEFWTPFPLPSIAVNDKLFRNSTGNNWSGQPQGLTYQRSIRALENYGHYAELTMLGQLFLQNLKTHNKFTQQYDPFTGIPNDSKDGYGPAILASLEFISRMHGIHISEDKVYWSCIDSGEDYKYHQSWMDHNFLLEASDDQVNCYINGQKILSFSKGIRIITDLNGQLLGAIGIEPKTMKASIDYEGNNYTFQIDPNCTFAFDGTIKQDQCIPFKQPF